MDDLLPGFKQPMCYMDDMRCDCCHQIVPLVTAPGRTKAAFSRFIEFAHQFRAVNGGIGCVSFEAHEFALDSQNPVQICHACLCHWKRADKANVPPAVSWMNSLDAGPVPAVLRALLPMKGLVIAPVSVRILRCICFVLRSCF